MELSEYGSNLCNAIDFMSRRKENVTVDKYVVMSNHAHLILAVGGLVDEVPGGGASGSRALRVGSANALVPKFVSSIKRYINKVAGFNMWQTSYHDRIIRNESEYQRIWKYIDENPLRWRDDCYYTV